MILFLCVALSITLAFPLVRKYFNAYKVKASEGSYTAATDRHQFSSQAWNRETSSKLTKSGHWLRENSEVDEVFVKIFEIACPRSKNCIEILLLLEKLKGNISPLHLKKLKLLFKVYGSTNHLFDAALLKVVGTCCNCPEKFQLLEHIMLHSKFYADLNLPTQSKNAIDMPSSLKPAAGRRG